MHWKKILYWLVTVLCLAATGISAWTLMDYWKASQETQTQYEELAQIVTTAATEASTVPPTAETSVPTEPVILPEYRELCDRNPHLVGWIEIPGTVINYPVVQTRWEPEHYLYRDFNGQDSEWGCIFADGSCDVSTSDNVTIYGHNMKDGTMFASLLKYDSEVYWQEHPTLRFDTLTQRQTYEIFAVFRTNSTAGEGFAYHEFADAASQREFDAFVARCKALSRYDTGITPEYGDRVLCLSTCEYSRINGRFVVAAVFRN